jgi:predicted O-linked N-acetylglucosamine transferase (SPINDLY family)
MRQTGNIDESLAGCDALIRLKPGDATALVERGLTLALAGRGDEAEAAFRDALALDPGHVDALAGVSRSLLAAHDADGAIAELDRGIRHAPGLARLHMLRGLLNQKRGRMADAQSDFRRAIELEPSDPQAYFSMGTFLLKVERHVEAVLFLEHAARLAPDMVDCYHQLAEVHRQLGHHSVAITLLEHGYGLAPERTDMRWLACWVRMNGCAWQDYHSRIEDLRARAIAAGQPLSPFLILAVGLSGAETLLWARAWAEAQMPLPAMPARRTLGDTSLRRADRIRVGYVSADFRGHAVAALVAEMFSLHDRSRFDLYGYNVGRVDGSALGRSMADGLDHLVDLAFLDDSQASDRIASDEIAILVDLTGFTTDGRPGIFAYRPAPIQVNYLGYPGTMGTKHIDYIIADPVVAPSALEDQFDEAVVRLPHSYQPNDRRRPHADPEATRAAHGLPDTGFVFCCFNANYKITPLVFGIWMRMLRDVPGSVLWLFQGNDLAEINLRNNAASAGIDEGRIVFAPRAPYDKHLGRLGLADLFLDTLPYNAHTTASEALWCGVPVLTCIGSQFAGRVAASLLTAVGLPELITASFDEYEREAIALARDPARIGALRARLAENRDTAPLFDTPRYVRNYEAALERMVTMHEAGEAPRAFAIQEPALT